MRENPSPLSLLLRQCGITHEELAEALGVSVDTVNNWCSGRSSMRIKNLASCLSLLAPRSGSNVDLLRHLLDLLRSEGLSDQAGVKLMLPSDQKRSAALHRDTVLYVAPTVFTKGNRLAVLGAKDYLSQVGMDMLLTSADAASENLGRSIAEWILAAGIRGVMVSRLTTSEWTRVIVEAATAVDAPVVGVYKKTGLEGLVRRFAWVDDYLVGYRAAKYLVKRGHRNLGFLALNIQAPTEADRLRGYQQGLKEEGINLAPDTTVNGSATPTTNPEIWLNDIAEVRPETKRALNMVREGQVSGLFCCSEPATMSLVMGLNAGRGGGRPRGCDVVGVALSTWPEVLTAWPLPYFLIPAYEIGRQAAKMVTINALGELGAPVAYEAIVECEFRGADGAWEST